MIPDITTMGKVIGGGLPVGAYGGRRDIMEHVAPAGTMYQAGTLSGNPLAMTAGIKTLEILKRSVLCVCLSQCALPACLSLSVRLRLLGLSGPSPPEVCAHHRSMCSSSHLTAFPEQARSVRAA